MFFKEHLSQLDPSSCYPSLEHKMCLAGLIIKVLATPLLGDTAPLRQGMGLLRSLSADSWWVSALDKYDQSSLICV